MTASDRERRAELERIAFGRDSSDAERAEAEAELRALAIGGSPAREEGVREQEAGARDDVGAPPRPADSTVGGAAASAGPGSRHRAWITRRSAVVAALALVVGVVVGWQASGALRSSDGLDPTIDADPDEVVLNEVGIRFTDVIPVRDSGAWAQVEREPRDGQPVIRAGAGGLPDIDLTTQLFLRERVDGARLFGAKSSSGEDLCIVVDLGRSAASMCTVDGVIPTDGIEVRGVFEQPYSSLSGVWLPDGTSTLE
ncbi:hypothetical protein [Agromyces marinus]|uniref:Uncharacterized protein n=1 Tax=Agromyces marinus TaxID=1389020 RepID=A0ABN6YB42_9MICO|nr:hypothetical protein [Agromyces marinus]UIP57322.1 hypothetical protein DSM26151_01770 [Agromyces marinus]BDZ54577.1 hypothetical protein GCM10025870_16500 [Agromyces marinus]